MMNKVTGTGKTFNASGNKVGLKVHSTYLHEKTPSELNKKYQSRIPRLKSLCSQNDGIKSRPSNPLYQTVVLKDFNLLSTPLLKRHKYLTRKYGGIWLRRVFGRQSPTKARDYRVSILLKKTFTEWRNICWCINVEWRLLIRADCHYKFSRIRKVWKRWHDHVALKKAMNRMAMDYEVRRHLETNFRKWKTVKLQLARNEAKAIEHGQLSIKRTWFTNWKRQYELISHQNQLMSKAVNHYKTLVLNKTLSQWTAMYNELKDCQIARCKFMNKLRGRILSTWYLHAKEKSVHKQLKEVADEFSYSVLLRRTLIKWRMSKTTHQRLTSLAVDSYRLSLLTKCYVSWREFSSCQKMQLSLHIEAINHYEQSLQNQLYRVLSNALLLRKQAERMQSIAIVHDSHTVIKCAWKYWLKKCELKEESKYKPLSIKANHHYQLCKVRKCFSYWKIFMKLKEQKYLVLMRATEHVRSKILPRYFEGFRLNVQLSLYQRHLKGQAIQFRRSILVSSAFYFWWRHCIKWLEEKNDLEIATDHYCSNLLSSFYSQWKEQTVTQLMTRSLEAQAIAHGNRQLAITFFNVWQTRLTEAKLRVEKEVVTIEHHCRKLMENVFRAWTMYLEHRRMVHAQQRVANEYYSTVVMSQCFAAWKIYNQRCLLVDMQLSKASAHYNTTISVHVFQHWKCHVKDVVRFKSMLLNSMYFARKRLLRKMFNHWHKTLLVVLEVKEQEDEMVQTFQHGHNKELMKTIFRVWYKKFKERTKQNAILKKALHHRYRLLMVNSWNKWVHYIEIRTYKKHLVMDANAFDDVRCVSLFYSLWRLKTLETQLVNTKISRALSYWSGKMHQKCFKCWKLFVGIQRAKTERYQRAMDGYRDQLLKEGVTQWIHISSKIQENRSKKAFVTYVEDFSNTFDIVKKCALHWKRKAAANSKRHRLEDPTLSRYTHVTNDRHTNKTNLSSCDSHVTTTNHWTEIVKSLQNSKMLPSLSRLPPRRPEYLTPYKEPPLVPSILDSIPNKEIVPQSEIEMDSVMDLSNDDIIENNNDTTPLTMNMIKPNEWKLLPPSVFIAQKK